MYFQVFTGIVKKLEAREALTLNVLSKGAGPQRGHCDLKTLSQVRKGGGGSESLFDGVYTYKYLIISRRKVKFDVSKYNFIVSDSQEKSTFGYPFYL